MRWKSRLTQREAEAENRLAAALRLCNDPPYTSTTDPTGF